LFLQAWLFGTHPRGGTLHSVSWDLSRMGIIILDDTFPVWRKWDHPLLLLISRAPTIREFPALDGFQYLANLVDSALGGDCVQAENGSVVPNVRSQLSGATRRLQLIVEYARSQHAPDDLAVLLPLSIVESTRLAEVERRSELDVQHLLGLLGARDGELSKLRKAYAQLEKEMREIKRTRTGQSPTVGITLAS
jgi:hypothetical protein